MKAAIIIPARWDSERFPGKPLAPILGKPLIHWTIEAARKTGLPVYVATDDERIFAEANKAGATPCMTSKLCRNGTERCRDAILNHGRMIDAEIIINWQGDACLARVEHAEALVEAIEWSGQSVATPAIPYDEAMMFWFASQAGMRGQTAVVMDRWDKALYFSKLAIPFDGPGWLHMGLYAYRRDVLLGYPNQPTALEESEGLEQLRWLEWGVDIQVAKLEKSEPMWEVNCPEDSPIVESVLIARNEGSN